MITWFEEWPERLLKEKFEVGRRFSNFNLKALADGRIAWVGSITTSSGRSYPLTVVYPHSFPRESPRAYPEDLPDSHTGNHQAHHFEDGSLCLAYPVFNSPSATAADVIAAAALWVAAFERFTASNQWHDDARPPGVSAADTKEPQKPTGMVFICYSHVDKRWLRRLRVHLHPLERQGLLELWDDTRIDAGDEWRAAISDALARAAVAVLLVSADFLASDFINSIELPALLAAREQRGLTVVPLLVAPSQFDHIDQLRRFQAVNAPSEPLTSVSRHVQERIMVGLARRIESIISVEGRRGD